MHCTLYYYEQYTTTTKWCIVYTKHYTPTNRTLYTILSQLYGVHCTLYTYKLYIILLQTVHYTPKMCSLYYYKPYIILLQTVHCTLYSCKPYPILLKLYGVQYPLYTILLQSVYYTIYYTLYSYTLYPLRSTLCSLFIKSFLFNLGKLSW